jgi:predicted nucleic acid-binding protein
MRTATIVADTSVLINFLKIDRMDLLGRHPCRFVVTDHVDIEIDDDEQRRRYVAALAAGHLETCTVIDPEEVALFMRLGPGQRLGAGECSAIAVALNRHYVIAIDDNKAMNRALREAGLVAKKLEVMRTPDLMVTLIRAGILTITEADLIKEIWEKQHRFRIKAASFENIL